MILSIIIINDYFNLLNMISIQYFVKNLNYITQLSNYILIIHYKVL